MDKSMKKLETSPKLPPQDSDEVWIINHMHFAQEWAITAHKERRDKGEETKAIPPKYWQHTKVFSKREATRFPPSHPEDHVIKLKPGAPDTMNCKVYPLMEAEQEATKKFIQENKTLQYIKKLDSP